MSSSEIENVTTKEKKKKVKRIEVIGCEVEASSI